MVYGQTVSVIVSIKSTFSTLGQSDVCHFRSILGPVGSLQINKKSNVYMKLKSRKLVYGQTVSVIVSIKRLFITFCQSDVCHFRSILGPVGILHINNK